MQNDQKFRLPNPRSLQCSVVDVFKSVVETKSHRTALQQGSLSLNYATLDARSNQLARVLRRHGLTVGSRAGMMMARSIDTIIACIAVLKLGAAYVPLDPNAPAASLAVMIDDADLALVVTEPSVNYAQPGRQVLTIVSLLTQARLERTDAVHAAIDGETAAYVMYTSGSTGPPKGVIVPHRGIVRLVCQTTYATFSPADTLLEVGPLGFDYSTLEIFGMLLNGGTVAILPDRVPTLSTIAEGIIRERATWLCLTPALFSLFVDHALETLAPLTTLFVAGDVVSVSHVDRFRARYPQCRLHNGYGPTENTTFTTCYTIPALGTGVATPVSATWGGGPVPIGPPINGTSAYILDDDHQLLPTGSVGTLWTGGAGVALGYLNQPSLTRERFRPDPFGRDPGALMYNTGDLVFERSDGALSFVGRSDRQVKIGGKRIELDAIEANLRADGRVREAAVTVRAVLAAEKEIVAFIELSDDTGDCRIARAILADMAVMHPAFMLPSRLIVSGRLPLTATGKIDRARLLRDFEAITVATSATLAGGTDPLFTKLMSTKPISTKPMSTDLADEIERIWCEVLHQDRIDRTANFFDVGGSSLRMIEVQARLCAALGRNVAITDLFNQASIASLTHFLAKGCEPNQALSQAREAGNRQRVALERRRVIVSGSAKQ